MECLICGSIDLKVVNGRKRCNNCLEWQDGHGAMVYQVIDLNTDESHGTYPTLEQARGCVAFDRLTAYSIWKDNVRVECCDPYESELTYLNYAHNRKLSPHISAEQWEPIYGPTTMTMEARYQRELVAERRLFERACKIETKRQAGS